MWPKPVRLSDSVDWQWVLLIPEHQVAWCVDPECATRSEICFDRGVQIAWSLVA